VNPSFIFFGLLVSSGPLSGFGDLPQARPIVDQTLLHSAPVLEALAAAESDYAAACREAVLEPPLMFFLWTLQSASAICPLVNDPGLGVRVTFRFAQRFDGTVSLRRTRIRTVAFGD